MASIDELNGDVAELKKLLESAERPRVKALLTAELNKCECALSSQNDSSKENDLALSQPLPFVESTTAVKPQKYYKDITSYGWDQSDKFMKIYVSLAGLAGVTKDNITAEYTNNSFRLKVENVDGKNYQCHVGPLWAKIVPADCFHKLKTDNILVMLKKTVEKKTWAFVTEREGKEDNKKKENLKPDIATDDPSAGIMNMLKKMYDDGDEEMKRTIAKSWTESRNKSGGDFDMPL